MEGFDEGEASSGAWDGSSFGTCRGSSLGARDGSSFGALGDSSLGAWGDSFETCADSFETWGDSVVLGDSGLGVAAAAFGRYTIGFKTM